MDIALQVAFIGLVSTLVVAAYNAWQEQERKRQSAELEYLRTQIGDFYGPLLGLLQQRRSIFEVSLAALPAENEKQLREQWSDSDWQAWHFLVENYLLQLNSRIVDLINSKAHLLEDAQMPPSLENFIKHVAQSDCLYALSKEKGLYKEAGRFYVPYPETIQDDVQNSLNSLRSRHERILRKQRHSKKGQILSARD